MGVEPPGILCPEYVPSRIDHGRGDVTVLRTHRTDVEPDTGGVETSQQSRQEVTGGSR